MTCTDNGADVSKARRLNKTAVENFDGVLWLDIDCLHHQYQLATHSLLKAAEVAMNKLSGEVRCFSSLQKVMNCWREHASAVYFLWKILDPQMAEKHASKMPPRCRASRQGGARMSAKSGSSVLLERNL